MIFGSPSAVRGFSFIGRCDGRREGTDGQADNRIITVKDCTANDIVCALSTASPDLSHRVVVLASLTSACRYDSSIRMTALSVSRF